MPSANECCGYLECNVRDINDKYGSTLFIARVLSAAVREELYSSKGWDLNRMKLVHQLSSSVFELSGDITAIPQQENGPEQ